MHHLPILNRTRVFEIVAVLITVLGKFFFMDFLRWKLPFIVVAIIFWSSYVIYQSRRIPGITRYWGFRTDNLFKAIRIILPFAFAAFILSMCIGTYQNTVNISWHIIPLLLLYPLWGVIQQFLLIALTAGNLQDLKNSKIPKTFSIFLSAALFGLIHYPFVWLMIGTFILAIFYGLIYLREKNLYALGIFHGWLAAVFFYTVVNRDPFVETFGGLLNLIK